MEGIVIKKSESKSWIFLVNARDHIEAGMLSSILSEAGIPVMNKSKGSGAYMEIYMGISHTGIDLYVPGDRLNEALQILRGQVEAEEQVEESGEVGLVDLERKRRKGKQLIIIIYLAPLALGIIYIIISGLIRLFTTV